jgi:adenylate cyclase
VAVLFADVRGSTSLAERMGAGEFANLLNRFYSAANSALLERNGLINRLIGDEVMAFFIPAATHHQHRREAALGAIDLMRSLRPIASQNALLPVGVGVHAGTAFVGKVGSDEIGDFTVLGDTVNTASRLQSEAGAGEIVMSEAVYETVADLYPDLDARSVTVRGRDEPVAVRTLASFD